MEKNKRRKWTHEEDSYLTANYSDAPMKDLMRYLDRTYYAVVGRVQLLGLKRSEEYMRGLVTPQMLAAGSKTRYKKGNKSWNKGTKGLMSKNKGSFKRKHKPHNWKPIGSERVTKEGYIEVKCRDEYLSKSNYELKQRLIWIEHYGSIPKGFVVSFKDGDIKNFDISNLELLSKRDNMLKNMLLDKTIAKRFLGTSEVDSDMVKPLIEMKRAELKLNQKIKEYEGS